MRRHGTAHRRRREAVVRAVKTYAIPTRDEVLRDLVAIADMAIDHPGFRGVPRCLSCGAVLGFGRRKFCSGSCARRFHRPPKEPAATGCKKCGAPIAAKPPGQKGRPRYFCDDCCNRRDRQNGWLKRGPRTLEGDCPACGKRFRRRTTATDARNDVYCSVGCAQNHRSARRDLIRTLRAPLHALEDALREVARHRTCAICGAPFVVTSGNRAFGNDCYCSPECARIGGNERRLKSHAREKGWGGRYEKIDSLAIFDRDGWRCHLCGKRVNKRLRWPHPLSASRDHIVPRSLSGDHVKTNIRLAHLTCNEHKGTRPVNEQTILL